MKVKNVITGCFLLIATSINALITFQKTFVGTGEDYGRIKMTSFELDKFFSLKLITIAIAH